MISLQINGKRVELEHPTRLLDYLERLGVNPRAVAVEHNGTIIERAAFDAATLDEKRAGLVWYVERVAGADTFTSHIIQVPIGDLDEPLYLAALWERAIPWKS